MKLLMQARRDELLRSSPRNIVAAEPTLSPRPRSSSLLSCASDTVLLEIYKRATRLQLDL